MSGITIYSYKQKGLMHDYVIGEHQRKVNFSFMAVCTIEITELVGIHITECGEVIGDLDFDSSTGSLDIDGY